MADIVSRKKRSEMMSRIRSKDTKPEKVVRSMLHRMCLRFRLQQKIGDCKPDIVLKRHKTAVLVHGCFWHRHSKCKYCYTPKTRLEFWQKKFNDNKARDKRNTLSLRKLGWTVVIIWECETKKADRLQKKLNEIFNKAL